ncbi:MAG: bifunctional metallophosphatase/5'-nucleotidase [Anaeromyxobacter sp.]
MHRSTIRLVPPLLALSLSCAAPAARAPAPTAAAHVRLLAFNDFHGQLGAGKKVDGRPAGSAGVFVAWLRAAMAGAEDRTLIVHAGDLVSASPPPSALLQEEPTVAMLHLLANERCRPLAPGAARADGADAAPAERFAPWLDPGCNLAGTVGNHEFDEGRAELLRLLGGGDHPAGPFLTQPWRGARYPTLAANVVDAATGRPILPAYVVKQVDGVPVGIVGVGLPETPQAVTPTGVAGLRFLDAAEAANAAVAALRGQGVRAVVVLVHQGGAQAPYAGPTRADAPPVRGQALLELVARLDPEVDVVVSGHQHAFTNALLPARGGRPVLVTQALSAGTAFARIDLQVDRSTRDVVAGSAEVQVAYADAGPGRSPDPAAAALQAAAEAAVAPRVGRVVATAAATLANAPDAAGESPLGDLVADALRARTPGAVAAVVNLGGIRTDLPAGPVTVGHLFAIHPFGNGLVSLTLTGAQLQALLEQQWSTPDPRLLQVSGLSYAWSEGAPVGQKVRDLRVGGAPVEPSATYRVATIDFLAGGGDGLTVITQGTDRVGGPLDVDALAGYLGSLPQPVVAPGGKRITRLP